MSDRVTPHFQRRWRLFKASAVGSFVISATA